MRNRLLTLGLPAGGAGGLAASTENRRFAFDSYRRLIQMYGEVVEGVDPHRFEQALADLKRERGVKQDVDLDADDLERLVGTFKGIYQRDPRPPRAPEPRGQACRAP